MFPGYCLVLGKLRFPISKEYFFQIIEDLISQEYIVGIIGLEEDKKIASDIRLHIANKNCIDLTGYTKNVQELMILFHFASLLITNDGGPGHFASMTSIPTIVFFGPETPALYGTLDDKTFNFHISLSCSPCLTAYNHRNSPCNGDNQCLKMIRPEAVLKKAYEILDKQKD